MHARDLHPPAASATPAVASGLATVLASSGGQLRLDHEGAELRAIIASSCLLEPCLGDRVWFVEVEDERYVISVLTRAQQSPASLHVDGDLEIAARGSIHVSAETVLALSTPSKLHIDAREMFVKTETTTLLFEELRATVGKALTSVTNGTRIGKTLELFVDRLTQRSRQVQRSVDGVELSESGTLIQRTRGVAHIQAKHALVNGTDVTKIDGRQVQLG